MPPPVPGPQTTAAAQPGGHGGGSGTSDHCHPWLQPLMLAGRAVLRNRVLPGPMEGLTTRPFCTALARRGLAHAWITPFLRISTAVPRIARLRRRLDAFRQTGLPVVVQLMGTDSALLAETAAHFAALGAVGIDLNCACPSPTVLRHGAGGARLRDPEWITAALTALRAACPGIGVSVKLRAGHEDAAELPAILAAVATARPDFVILHFRTVREGYSFVPDGWKRLALARHRLPDIPLLASGDLFEPAAALELYRRTGVDGCAPARGLLRNPWLLRQIEARCCGVPPPEPEPDEKFALLHEIGEAGAAEGLSRAGPLIELARHLFGPAHSVTSTLITCQNLTAALEALSAARTQTATSAEKSP